MEYQNTNRTRKCLSCKLVRHMSWDGQFGCLSNICKKCENPEPIPEYGEIRCISCNRVSKEILFWDTKGTKLLKTCQVCRVLHKKKSRENNEVMNIKNSIKSQIPRINNEIDMTTVVSSQNMSFIFLKIVKYCDNQIAWDITGEDRLEIYMIRNGKHFTLKEGDTWEHVNEMMQSCVAAEPSSPSSSSSSSPSNPRNCSLHFLDFED